LKSRSIKPFINSSATTDALTFQELPFFDLYIKINFPLDREKNAFMKKGQTILFIEMIDMYCNNHKKTRKCRESKAY